MLFCKEESLSRLLLRNEFYCSTFDMKSWGRRSILGSLFNGWIAASNWLLLHHGRCFDWSRSVPWTLLRKTAEAIQTSQKTWFWFKANRILMVCVYLLILSLLWRFSKGIRSFLIERSESHIQYSPWNIWRNARKATNFKRFWTNLRVLFIRPKEN